MTSSPSDNPAEAAAPTDDLAAFAAQVAEAVGASAHTLEHGTIKVVLAADQWVDALTTARDELDLIFFSYLSAIDWSNEVAVGDPPAEEVEERYEVLCGLSDLTAGNFVHFTTDVSKDAPTLPSVTSVFSGAAWHEREAAEMFGIEFAGHPNPGPLYLPDAFEGNPLQKSYPLLSREVKPWPGKVDVEDMPPAADEPSTENPEA